MGLRGSFTCPKKSFSSANQIKIRINSFLKKYKQWTSLFNKEDKD